MCIAYSHLVSTILMAGLIWFVQVVHYPLFHKIGKNELATYALEHQRRTARVVGLPMLVEGISTLWLFFDPVNGRTLPLIGGLILCKIHLSTIFLQIPKHAALIKGYNEKVVSRLVQTNWIRTIGWSVRTVIAVLIIVSA